MNEIQLFNNEELNCKVRTVEIDGKPYFVGMMLQEHWDM